ncbi:MAG: response regulator [Bdellovibrionales bacterium]
MGPCSVAIIEDEEEIREGLRDAIEAEGYCVATYANGQEALEGLVKVAPPGLILLDLMMPQMDGWQFLKARQDLPKPYSESPLYIVSAVADLHRVESAGAAGYMRKPLDLDVLLKVVETYCGPALKEKECERESENRTPDGDR